MTEANFVKQHENNENIRIATEKQNIFTRAATMLATALLSFGKMDIKATADTLVETEPSTYSGDVTVNVGINTEAGIKTIPVVVKVANSDISIPNSEGLVKRVVAQLEEMSGPVDNIIEESILRANDKIDSANKMAEINKIVIKNIEAGMSVFEARKQAFAEYDASIEKQAKNYEIGTGFTECADTNSIFETITYPKQLLPSTIKPGKDTISFNGRQYQVVGSTPALSTGKDDGAQWVLKLVK